VNTDRSLRAYQLVGAALVLLLAGGMGGWAALASIAGAVIAPAVVAVDSNSKKIQHKEGGIVAEIGVQQGDYVAAGTLLVRLDDTETRANLAIVEGQLDELTAEHARLEAERVAAESIDFPADLMARAAEDRIARILDAQRKLMTAERETLAAQAAQYSQQIAQLGEEVEGLKAQRSARLKAMELIEEEVADLKPLLDKGLITTARYNALLREQIDLHGEAGRLQADMARAKGAIAETELKILQLDQDQRARVLGRLTEVRTKIVSLLEQKIAAEARLARIDIVAPISGRVHEIAVHTLGGVVGPGETLMMIVPQNEELVLEARVKPEEVDDIHIGQQAVLRFPAFNQRTTPEVFGIVDRIGADLSTDPATKLSFFAVRIRMEADKAARLGDNRLHPGMPAEAFIGTGERTALDYFMRPFLEQFARAFREQ
jgi:HlyD family secretion protein